MISTDAPWKSGPYTSSCSGIPNRKKWATMYHMLTGKNDFTRPLQQLELSFARWLTTKDGLQDYWWRRTFTQETWSVVQLQTFTASAFSLSFFFFVNPFYCSPCFLLPPSKFIVCYSDWSQLFEQTSTDADFQILVKHFWQKKQGRSWEERKSIKKRQI